MAPLSLGREGQKWRASPVRLTAGFKDLDTEMVLDHGEKAVVVRVDQDLSDNAPRRWVGQLEAKPDGKPRRRSAAADRTAASDPSA